MARRWLSGKEYPPQETEIEGLKLLVREDEELPEELEKAQLRRLLPLAYLGWLLYRARQRKAAAEKKADQYRDRILERLPLETIRGIESRVGKRAMRVLVVEHVGLQVSQPVAFLNYLGPHVADVVQRVEISPVLTLDPDQWQRLAEALKAYLGEDAKSLEDLLHFNLVFDLDKLRKTIESGGLEEPPEEYFELVPKSPRVDAKPLA